MQMTKVTEERARCSRAAYAVAEPGSDLACRVADLVEFERFQARSEGVMAERAVVVKYLRALAVDEDLYLSATSAGLAKQWADAIEKGEHHGK